MEGSSEAPSRPRSQIADYLALFETMSPSYSGAALTRAQCCRVLPLASCIQMLWVIVFFIVELTGGAGGTSGVAGTRAVIFFFLYIFQLIWAVMLSRASSRGTVRRSICLVYAILSSIMLASMLGSATATFGVEVCNGTATLGPVPDYVPGSSTPWVDAPLLAAPPPVSTSGGTSQTTPAPSTIRFVYNSRSRCGIDSVNRGAKIVFEFIFSLIFGLPTLLAAFTALLDDTNENDCRAIGVKSEYVMNIAQNGDSQPRQVVFADPRSRDLEMLTPANSRPASAHTNSRPAVAHVPLGSASPGPGRSGGLDIMTPGNESPRKHFTPAAPAETKKQQHHQHEEDQKLQQQLEQQQQQLQQQQQQLDQQHQQLEMLLQQLAQQQQQTQEQQSLKEQEQREQMKQLQERMECKTREHEQQQLVFLQHQQLEKPRVNSHDPLSQVSARPISQIGSQVQGASPTEARPKSGIASSVNPTVDDYISKMQKNGSQAGYPTAGPSFSYHVDPAVDDIIGKYLRQAERV